MLGINAYFIDRYVAHPNEFTGTGRSDITAEPRGANKSGFIIEFKVAGDESEYDKPLSRSYNLVRLFY